MNEWGVRFPGGSVEVFPDEASARRYSLNLNGLRSDLPTAVVRQIVTGWTEVEEA